jgi:hypothetical protein
MAHSNALNLGFNILRLLSFIIIVYLAPLHTTHNPDPYLYTVKLKILGITNSMGIINRCPYKF